MMLLTGYKSRKDLAAAIGQPLLYKETSVAGPEYKANGSFAGAHRPLVTGLPGREFFAEITMKDGLIAKVK